MTTPFHALIPYGIQREPGLIIASHVGQIRFWDSIGMGLAGGDNFSSFTLDLEHGENVSSLTRADVGVDYSASYIHDGVKKYQFSR